MVHYKNYISSRSSLGIHRMRISLLTINSFSSHPGVLISDQSNLLTIAALFNLNSETLRLKGENEKIALPVIQMLVAKLIA